MTVNREIVYLGRDNTIDFILKADGEAQSLSAVTHMEMVISGVTYSSVTSGYFDWSGSTTGYVSVSLGQSSVTTGVQTGRLIVYDSLNTNGILWGKVPLKVEG